MHNAFSSSFISEIFIFLNQSWDILILQSHYVLFKSGISETFKGNMKLREFYYQAGDLCHKWLKSSLHSKYLQPIYSHWLCYISNCNLAVIITANGSTYDTHWHWGVQFEIKYYSGLYYVQPNYRWKCNTVKSCTEYSQDICSALVTQYAQFWETLFHKWSNNADSSFNTFILVQKCLLPWFSKLQIF